MRATSSLWVVMGLAALTGFGLAGCVDNPPVLAVPPVVTPPPVVAPLPPAAPLADPPRSTASQELSLYYRRLQNDLLAQDLMRGDGGGPDTPFTAEMLARDFIRIALFDEFAPGGGTPKPASHTRRAAPLGPTDWNEYRIWANRACRPAHS